MKSGRTLNTLIDLGESARSRSNSKQLAVRKGSGLSTVKSMKSF